MSMRNLSSDSGEKIDKEANLKTKAANFQNHKPTIAYAQRMPHDFSEMRHEVILQLCVEGVYDARREALIRNVMAVDSIEYDEASHVVDEISKVNRSGMTLAHAPYHLGLAGSLGVGLFSFPLVFDYDTVSKFNERFVTADVPEAKDLQTWLEVGSWSWGWMEPVIGQVSFVLLVLQFARNQMLNLGLRPYGNTLKENRATSLEHKYPQYDRVFVRWFAKSDTLYNSR